MKNAFLLSPLIAAICFTVPESWQLMHTPDAEYIPVVYELLMLVFGFLTAAIINGVVLVPLCLLVMLKSSNLMVGIVLAMVVSLTGTTVAYAFEIFDYQPSILHPSYLYPLLIPLFVMTVVSFFCLARRESVTAKAEVDTEQGADANAAPDEETG